MAGITNAINMAHKGTYKELQSMAPGATWQESFWIRAERVLATRSAGRALVSVK